VTGTPPERKSRRPVRGSGGKQHTHHPIERIEIIPQIAVVQVPLFITRRTGENIHFDLSLQLFRFNSCGYNAPDQGHLDRVRYDAIDQLATVLLPRPTDLSGGSMTA
jgi:hypothetical protein